MVYYMSSQGTDENKAENLVLKVLDKANTNVYNNTCNVLA